MISFILISALAMGTGFVLGLIRGYHEGVNRQSKTVTELVIKYYGRDIGFMRFLSDEIEKGKSKV